MLLNTSVVPIYFNAINTGASSADLVVAWGNAQTIASLVIAMLMPILGALADYAATNQVLLGLFPHGPGSLPGAGYPNVRHGIFDRVRAVHHRP
ncbi:MAG: hypothetical protein ACLU37_09725 [Collinsella sp.]